MLTLGIFSIGLAIGVAFGRKQMSRSSIESSGAGQSIGLNGILVTNH